MACCRAISRSDDRDEVARKDREIKEGFSLVPELASCPLEDLVCLSVCLSFWCTSLMLTSKQHFIDSMKDTYASALAIDKFICGHYINYFSIVELN